MGKTVFVLPEGDLASRTSAASVRVTLVALFERFERLEIDCSNVQDMSESYADEVFGILVLKFGFDSVLRKIKISKAKQEVLLSIASVMRRRKNQTSSKRFESISQNASYCHV